MIINPQPLEEVEDMTFSYIRNYQRIGEIHKF
jgi:hypothetical protein